MRLPTIRPMKPEDVEQVAAAPETAHCLVRDGGSLGGFVVRAPWGQFNHAMG
jgi:hypothetical protein